MTEHAFAPFDSFQVISEYPLAQAIEDGTVVAVTACPEPLPARPKPLDQIASLDGYLLNYGKTLGRKAIHSLDPLHVPNVSPMPDMDDLLRDPFEAQKHVVAAVVRMLNTTGSGFIVGSMGSGKTLLGMSAVFKHAQLSRKKGGKGGRFRCLVLAPDHLIAKWKREIEETIPEATVYHFGSLNEMDRKARAKIDGKTGQAPALADLIALLDKGYRSRWSKPDGPEFYVIGRDQIKWLPGLLGTSDPYKGFNCVGGLLGGKRVVSEVGQHPDGTPITAVAHVHGAGSSTPVQKPLTSKTIVVDQEPMVDAEGKPVKGPDGRQKVRNVTAQVFTCPCCGGVIRDRKGVPVSAATISKAAKANANLRCENLYLQQLPSAEGKNSGGLDVISPVPDRFRDKSVGTTISIGTNRYVVKKCGEPLWSYTSSPYRFMLGRIIQKKFRRFFDYLLIDECFPGGTRILTPDGWRMIRDVRPGDRVYSLKDGEIVVRRVSRAIGKRLTKLLIRVTHSHGSVVCTPNHKILVRGLGYISAGDIKHGDMLSLAERSPDHESSCSSDGSMPGVRDRVRTEVQAAEAEVLLFPLCRPEAGYQGDEAVPGVRHDVHLGPMQESVVLLDDMLDEASLEGRGCPCSIPEGDGEQVGDADPRGIRAHETNEPGCRIPGEGGQRQEGSAVRRNPWGQRDADSGAEGAGAGHRLRHGVSRQDGDYVVEMRHVGPGRTGTEDRSGGGWPDAHDETSDREGSAKGVHLGGAGLDAPSLHQRGDQDAVARGAAGDPGMRVSPAVVISVECVVTDDEWVYDLEVEDTHCYFAEGILVSNCHEQKSDESGQSLAASKLIGAANHVLALTGTIIGGYAKDLFALLLRICPDTLKAEGFEWGKDLPFSEVYGRIDRIVKVSEEGASATVAKNVRSMRRAKTGKATERKAIRPGVMPTLFGRHMIGNTVFITLDEMAEGLPDLFEYIGGECPPPPEPPPADASQEDREKYESERDAHERMKAFWVDTACDMEPSQKAEYDRIEATLEFASKELLRRGSMKLLGTMLATTLGYPDFCYSEWGIEDEKLIKALKTARAEGIDIPKQMQHVVGYWDKPGIRDITNWMGVLTPKVLDPSVVYPKEQRLIDICKLHKAAGHQTWVYVQMTGKRNVLPRLKMLLEREGLRVGLLKSGDVDPKEREEWIAAHGRDFDVMMCFPKMVSTGLDLFSKVQGGHNYNAIVFYETGYKLNDMRQAARRAWRIGQPRDCSIYYLYYKGTMQHRAMSLMSKKMAAALALEGEFSEDGLAAMAGEDNMQMAMAKSMSEAIDDADMQRSWSKVKSLADKKKPIQKRAPVEAIAALAQPEASSPLDEIEEAAQLLARTVLERQKKAVPVAAKDDIAALAERFAQADAGMWAAARMMADEAAYDAQLWGDPEPEPEAKPEPVVERPTLRVHQPEPEPAPKKVYAKVDDIVFDDDLLAKMMANLAANGMSAADIFG